jgi:transposase
MERFKDTASNLSAIQTCRFQGRSVVDFLADALKAHAGTGEQPSLIPDT